MTRHDICQKIYTTSLFGAKILHKKCVNRDNGTFTTNQRKCQIYYKNAKMLQNNIHGTYITIDKEGNVPLVGWVNIYTIFTPTHKCCVNINLYTMWVNCSTIFTQYLPKYVQKLGKFLHILCVHNTKNVTFSKLLHKMCYDCANTTQ